METFNDSLICVCGQATPVRFSRATKLVQTTTTTVQCSGCRCLNVVRFSWLERTTEAHPLGDVRKAVRELEAYEANRDRKVGL